jgi:hypothetical protein
MWAEVKVDGEWVHLDPCEAAVGENLIYQGWGKKQTFIFAFSYSSPFVEDVTALYTSNFTASLERRLSCNVTEDVIQNTLRAASKEIQELVKH